MRVLLIFFMLASASDAATYYVRADGNNGNNGLTNSVGGAWLTITYAESQATTGDVVRVQAGTYNERVPVNISGASDDYITFIADGTAVCRGFDLTGVSYFRIIGFEITHTTADYSRAIALLGTCSYIEIIDNYIHETIGTAIQGRDAGLTSYITVRGNSFYLISGVPGVSTNAGTVATGLPSNLSYWLVEYNTLRRIGDGINLLGNHIIARNNHIHEFSNILLNTTDAYHSDIFQAGSDGVAGDVRHHVYESNLAGNCIETNSHYAIFQDTVADGDTNIMHRGNIAFNFGNGGIGARGTDKVVGYNNTFYKLSQASAGTAHTWYESGADYAVDGMCANSIIYDDGLGTDALVVQSGGNSATLTHNLGHLAGTESSYVSTNDPLFVSAATTNFFLQAASPAIDAGTNVVSVTTADASGTTFDVSDGDFLRDGYGKVDGDTITVGGTTTRITSIATNTVTVADSVTWTNGMAVYWGTDTTPDIGALPYGSTKLTAATISNSGTTYTVLVSGDARGVWFYVDGIPTTWDADSPYSAVIGSGTVSAKAYALYAQTDPVVTATAGPWPIAPDVPPRRLWIGVP